MVTTCGAHLGEESA